MNKSNVVSIAGNPRIDVMYLSTDEALESDRDWFQNNNNCMYRLRESFPGEFPVGEMGTFKGGVRPFTLVTQLRPGVRIQLCTPVPHDVDPSDFEQIHLGVVAHLVGGTRYKALVDEYEKHRN